MNAAALLDRLTGVRQTAPGRWLAKCPVHEDRSPSLSIREVDGGRVLIYDFGGCQTGDVLSALGLELKDLYPARLPGSGPAGGYSRSHSNIPARDLLEILDHEVTVAALILADVLRDRTFTDAQWARLATAAGRIGKARDHGRA